ncbi:sugar transferase [uncultured Hoeflea sp.]|uniref:sugar transferase n=1 Tax=uncultured Hoeflea sp. TaxID=538666 RepID=UPI00261391D6|nr:sugar transferase [uncultured Hoeflea sp.]
MKIVITGATGYVGRNLIPLIQKRGTDLLLVGRDPSKVSACFPGVRCCGYGDLVREAQGYTTLLHMAVLNTNSNEPLETFLDVNVNGALETAELARKSGIKTFVNVSSTHALDPTNTSYYAISKRKAAAELAKLKGLEVISIYLPYVYEPKFSDRLSFLSRLPSPLARLMFHVIASRRPTVSIDRIAGFIEDLETDGFFASLPAPAILSDGQADNPAFAFFKRVIDVLFALVVVVLFWWLLVVIWVLIRTESKGPGIVAQEKIGRDGRPFTCYRFRTTKSGPESLEMHRASAAPVTRLGRALRKLNLDELPQIINIFRNEMSLVGPSACLPEQRELVDARRQLGVLALKPGVCSLAQMNGIDMNDPEIHAQWDARYMALQSLRFDWNIFIAAVLGSGK